MLDSLLVLPFILLVMFWLASQFSTRRRGDGGFLGPLRASAAAWEALGYGVSLGTGVAVFIAAAHLPSAPNSTDWIGLVFAAGFFTFLVFFIPRLDQNQMAASLAVSVFEFVVGGFAVIATVAAVVQAEHLARAEKAMFLVPLAFLVLLGGAIAGAMQLPGFPLRSSSGLQAVAEIALLALIATELMVGMHLPALAPVFDQGSLGKATLLIFFALALIAVVLLPALRAPAGVLTAAVALLGDWDDVRMAAGTPISFGGMTMVTIAVVTAAAFFGTGLRRLAFRR